MTKAMAKSAKQSGYPALVGNANAKKNGSKHDWNKQFGPGKDFEDKDSFMTWLHKAPVSGKSTAKKNGLTWFWYEKCVRYTSHKGTECTKTTKRQKGVAFAGMASAGGNISSGDSMVSAVDWSDSEAESLPPARKKSRTSRAKKIKRKKSKYLSSDSESGSDE